MKIICLLLTLFFLQDDYGKPVKTKVADGITMMLPETLHPMSEQDLAAKYISHRMPLAAYTSPDRRADLTVNTANTAWQEADVGLMHNFYKASIVNLFTEVDFIKEETAHINDKAFSVFEFISVLEGDENSFTNRQAVETYNYIAYTIVNGQAMVFSFNASASQKDQWQHTAHEMMQSIKIKKTLR